MKTKPYDNKYCGVRKSVIKSANPQINSKALSYLHQFITERYKIHIKKDVYKEAAPWTKDPVLREFRFTNVRREHDRETKWVIDNIAKNNALCYEDKLLNLILFRLFNKHETAELIHIPIRFQDFSEGRTWDPEKYRCIFERAIKEDPKRILFTGAFITGGLKRALKQYLPKEDPKNSMEMRVLWCIKALINDDVVKKIKSSKDQKEVFDVLCKYDGLGEFLSYQIFVDFTYIKEFPFSENEFVVAGPGCKKGLDCLFIDRGGMTYEECLFWLRDNIDNLFISYGFNWSPKAMFRDIPTYDRYMNVMSLENCFCELSKYIRATEGYGRPRQKYKSHKDV